MGGAVPEQCLPLVGAPCNPQGRVLMLHAGGPTVVLTTLSTAKSRLNLCWPMILDSYCFPNLILRDGQLSNVNLAACHGAYVLEADRQHVQTLVPCQHNSNNGITMSAMLIEIKTKPGV